MDRPSDSVIEAAKQRGATWDDAKGWTYSAPSVEADNSKMSPEHQSIIARNKATLIELRAKKQSRADSTAAFLERIGQKAPTYDTKLLTKLGELGEASPNTPNWTLLEQAVSELGEGNND